MVTHLPVCLSVWETTERERIPSMLGHATNVKKPPYMPLLLELMVV